MPLCDPEGSIMKRTWATGEGGGGCCKVGKEEQSYTCLVIRGMKTIINMYGVSSLVTENVVCFHYKDRSVSNV